MIATLFMNDRIFPHFFTNPIQTLHRLKEAGFTEKQAEVQVEIASECFNECFKNIEATIATKRDLKELEISLKKELREIKLRFESKFREIDFKFKELETKLTIKSDTITSAIVGFFYLLEKFF